MSRPASCCTGMHLRSWDCETDSLRSSKRSRTNAREPGPRWSAARAGAATNAGPSGPRPGAAAARRLRKPLRREVGPVKLRLTRVKQRDGEPQAPRPVSCLRLTSTRRVTCSRPWPCSCDLPSRRRVPSPAARWRLCAGLKYTCLLRFQMQQKVPRSQSPSNEPRIASAHSPDRSTP
jgi:hypothetical protein